MKVKSAPKPKGKYLGLWLPLDVAQGLAKLANEQSRPMAGMARIIIIQALLQSKR